MSSTAALQNAVRTRDRAQILHLLESEPELVNARDERGTTPLILATYLGDLETTKILVEAGADLDAVSGSGTALMGTCFKGHALIAKYLVEAGANVNARGPGGKTALHFAAEYNQPGIVVGLLESGADAGAMDDSGATPAMVARRKGLGEVMRVFI